MGRKFQYVVATAMFLLCGANFRADAQSQSVQQSGAVSSGHASRWVYNGILGDAGPATNGLLTEEGFTKNTGYFLCGQNTATHTGPYVQLCFGVDSSNGYIALNGYGGVTPALNITVNGAPYTPPIPTTLTPLRTIQAGSSDTVTIADSNGTIAWDSSVALAKTETLPTCSVSFAGFTVGVKDEIGTAGTYPITVTSVSTIDNQPSYIIAFNKQFVKFQCDATTANWIVE